MRSPKHIHSFPNEVLYQIFQYTIHDTASAPSLTQAPFNISQVCERWRYIALHPAFWSDIVLSDPSLPAARLFNLFLERALSRAGARPLSVKYHGKRNDRQEDRHRPMSQADLTELQFMRFLTYSIDAQRSVWREVDLDFSFCGPLRLDPVVVSQGRLMALGPLPFVERLSLAAPSDCCVLVQSHLDLSESFHLRELNLRGYWAVYLNSSFISSNYGPSLLSLTTLEIDCDSDTVAFSPRVQCLHLLSHAPNLQSLTVRSTSKELPPPHLELPLLRLENLRKLRVVTTGGHTGTISNFLLCIECPGLQQLVVQSLMDDTGGEPIPILASRIQYFFKRSKCALEVLKIHSHVISEEGIISFLLLVPNLRSLVISGCGDLSERILSILSTQPPEIGWPSDKARKIVFDRCTFGSKEGHTDMAEEMMRMIKSRWNSRLTPSEGLEVVLSDCGIDFDPDMREELEIMIKDGLKFSTAYDGLGAEFDDVDEV